MKRLILALLTGAAFAASSPAYAAVKTIVLVHGAFADGSGWKPVADILQSHGYSVLVVQEPETSFAADVAATRRVLDKAGPCVLVGHSYGGMIITETGMHPDVKALVYVAAMQPDVGESLSDLAGKMPAAAKSIGPVGDGFLAVNPDAFPNDFAADTPKPVARLLAPGGVGNGSDVQFNVLRLSSPGDAPCIFQCRKWGQWIATIDPVVQG